MIKNHFGGGPWTSGYRDEGRRGIQSARKVCAAPTAARLWGSSPIEAPSQVARFGPGRPRSGCAVGILPEPSRRPAHRSSMHLDCFLSRIVCVLAILTSTLGLGGQASTNPLPGRVLVKAARRP